jgi:hypothetical protein
MVAVGRDRHRIDARRGRRRDREPVASRLHVAADAGQLRRERGDAVGLLHAERLEPGQPARALRTRARDREGHGGVGEHRAVMVGGAKRGRTGHDDLVVAAVDAHAHRLERREKPHVGLRARAGEPRKGDPRPGHERREKRRVRGAAGVGLDREVEGFDRLRAHLVGEKPAVGAGRRVRVDSDRPERLHRQRDVRRARRRNEVPKRKPARQHRRDQEERREELARRDIADVKRAAGDARRRAHRDGQALHAVDDARVDRRAESAQEFDPLVDRSLAHARAAVDRHVARGERRKREEKARGRAAVPEMHRAAARQPSAGAFDDRDRLVARVVALVGHPDAERRERRREAVGVVGAQQSAEPRASAGKRRQDQEAIRETLRAGHANRRRRRRGLGPERLYRQRIGQRIGPRIGGSLVHALAALTPSGRPRRCPRSARRRGGCPLRSRPGSRASG